MGTSDEISEIPEKFRIYRDQLVELCKKHEIDGLKSLVYVYRTDSSFRREWGSIWARLATEDGGKISLTTIGIVIGSVLGGMGIAVLGGAIGLPLALVLGLGGLLSGSKIDSLGWFGKKKRLSVKLEKKVIAILESEAEKSSISKEELAALLLEAASKEFADLSS